LKDTVNNKQKYADKKLRTVIHFMAAGCLPACLPAAIMFCCCFFLSFLLLFLPPNLKPATCSVVTQIYKHRSKIWGSLFQKFEWHC